MSIFYRLIKKMPLLFIGIMIHTLFYISIWHSSHFMNIFFPIGQLHQNYVGLDFYQIPMGAYNYYRYNGTLEGEGERDPKGFTKGKVCNKNVYHPIITLTLGGILQLFSPEISSYIWQVFKLLITCLTVFFLISRFLNNKNIDFVIFIYLAFFSQYQELKIAQYQFLLNHFLLFGLIYLYDSKVISSLAFVLSLLVKPIILTWYPVLLYRKHFLRNFIFLVLFFTVTVPFYFWDKAGYYFSYLNMYLTGSHILDATDLYALSGLLHKKYSLSPEIIKYFKIIFSIGILSMTLIKRVPLITIFLGLTLSFFLFGFRVYEYHYTLLIPLLIYGFLKEKSWDNRVMKGLAFICSLPSIFIVFRIFKIANVGDEINEVAWQYVILSKMVPVAALLVSALYYSLRRDEVQK